MSYSNSNRHFYQHPFTVRLTIVLELKGSQYAKKQSSKLKHADQDGMDGYFKGLKQLDI